MTRAQFTTTVIAVVILVSLLLFWAYRAKVEKDITVAIIAASATILASVIVVSITQYSTKTAEVAEAHRLKKTEVYSEFGGLVFDIFQMIKIPDRPNLAEEDKARLVSEAQTELQVQYSSFTKKLLLWGFSGRHPHLACLYGELASTGHPEEPSRGDHGWVEKHAFHGRCLPCYA